MEAEVVVKPGWLKIRPSYSTDFSKIKNALRKRGLVTVCEEAHCPNMAECWHNEGTATFMVMGDTCTRGCRFCAISKGIEGKPLDPFEPKKIADAIREMGLDYAVITSVDRDDLPDEGSSHFAKCIDEIKKSLITRVEVLIPDFNANPTFIKKVVDAKPDVIAHNIETVERLQGKVRDRKAGYKKSLEVLRIVKEQNSEIVTKSSIMIGLGEEFDEVVETMKSLRSVDCDILTLGQYLKPKNRNLTVVEYVNPEIFQKYKEIGMELGFKYVASGPFVRSSYRAGEFFIKNILEVGTYQEK